MDRYLALLLAKEPPAVVRYGATTLMMAAVGAAQYIIALRTGLPGLSSVLAGIFVSAFLFGRYPGFYATALASASAYFVLQHQYPNVPIVAALVLFVAIGIGVTLITDFLRSALKRAITAEREKDLLFRELTHRAQNNLALIVAMAQLQGRAHPDPQVRAALASLVTRITSLAEAQKYFTQASSERVDVAAYLESLCAHLRNSLSNSGTIAIRCSSERLNAPADKALALGLMTNEFVTNAVKYAFPGGRAGAIDVAVKTSDGAVELTVSDNGQGYDPNIAGSFGTRLVDVLAGQHKAEIARENTNPGFRVTVTMPIGRD